jgi:hypothetical protein
VEACRFNTFARIAAAEQRLGHTLPRDLRALHAQCSEVSLCEGRYVFLPPERKRQIRHRREVFVIRH